MENLEERFDVMTEKTAEELSDIMKEFNESLGDVDNFCKMYDKVIRQEMARQVVDKFLGYVEKYVSANFITRWYWKRKAKKMALTVKMLQEFLNKE